MYNGIFRLYADLWSYSRGARHTMAAAYVLITASELIKLALPALAGLAIDSLQHQGIAGMREAALNGALMFLCLLSSWIFLAPGRVLERNMALHLRSNVAAHLTSRLLDAPLSWHRMRHFADSSSRLLQGSQALYGFAESQYLHVCSAVSLLGPVVALTLISPALGAAAALGYALLIAVSLRFDRLLVRLGTEQNDHERRYTSALMDIFGKIVTVTALRHRKGAASVVANQLAATRRPAQQIILHNELRWATIDLLANGVRLGLVGLYVWLFAHKAQRGLSSGLALGSVFMVYEYAQRAAGVISAIVEHLAMVNGQFAGYAAIQPILGAEQEIRVDQLESTQWHRIELTGLGYCYTEGMLNKAILRNVDLSLVRGRRYALIGSSGSGKTTLLQLLAGLEAPSSGGIRFDGVPMDKTALRREATLIPQRADAFEGSVRHNLLLGGNDGHEHLVKALTEASAEDFVFGRAGGLDATVAEQGSNWSGGQRQRLALARGLLAARGSGLLLLDEPCTGLDVDTERRVLERILRAAHGSCVVAAVHGLHVLDLFDDVLVMDDGRIVEHRRVGRQLLE